MLQRRRSAKLTSGQAATPSGETAGDAAAPPSSSASATACAKATAFLDDEKLRIRVRTACDI